MGSAVDGARYGRGAHANGTDLAGRQRPVVLTDDLQRHMRQHAPDRLRPRVNIGAVQYGHAAREARRVALDKVPAEHCPRPALLVWQDGSTKAVKRVEAREEIGSLP